MMQGGMPPPPPGKTLRHQQIKSHWIDSHAPKKTQNVILTDIQTFQVSLTCTCKECHLQVDFVHNACRKVSE